MPPDLVPAIACPTSFADGAKTMAASASSPARRSSPATSTRPASRVRAAAGVARDLQVRPSDRAITVTSAPGELRELLHLVADAAEPEEGRGPSRLEARLRHGPEP